MIKMMCMSTEPNRIYSMVQMYSRSTPLDAGVQFTTDPDEADIIFFFEVVNLNDLFFARVTSHPIYQEYAHKCILYNEADTSNARIPAVCVNARPLPWQVPFGSLPTHVANIPLKPMAPNPKHLMSLVGSESSDIRKKIFDFYQAQDAIISTDSFDNWTASSIDRAKNRKIFTDAMMFSRFSLCPRGVGTSSLRLYESLQAARCPVIISDTWVPDYGIDWDSFAIRVKESDYRNLRHILHEYTIAEAIDRGVAGRSAWEQSYAPDRYLITLARAGMDLLAKNPVVPPRTMSEIIRDTVDTGMLVAKTLKHRLIR